MTVMEEYKKFLKLSLDDLKISRLEERSKYKHLDDKRQVCCSVVCEALVQLQQLKESYEDAVLAMIEIKSEQIQLVINKILFGLEKQFQLQEKLYKQLESSYSLEQSRRQNNVDRQIQYKDHLVQPQSTHSNIPTENQLKDEKLGDEVIKECTDLVKIEADFSEELAIENNSADTCKIYTKDISGNVKNETFNDTESFVEIENDIHSDKSTSYAVKPDSAMTIEKPFECDVCHKRYTQACTLTEHKFCHSQEKCFQCDECEKRFSSKRKLRQHQETHQVNRPHKCEVCNQAFKTRGTLKLHLRLHTGNKKYECDQCDAKFFVPGRLATHYRIHTGEKPFQCHKCAKVYARKENLVEHLKSKHEEFPVRVGGSENDEKRNVRRFKCSLCDKRFKRNCDLEKHHRIHTGEKPFSCHICANDFRDRKTLIVHTRIHTGEKPFCCELCGHGVRQKSHLIEHMRTHTGEKPFKCEECGKTLATKKNLLQHQRIHTGEKPFRCEQCGWAFRGKENLTKHLRTHSGEKLYKCDTCQKYFSTNFRLNEHIRLHTGEKPFECEICHERFRTTRVFNKHKTTHSGLKPVKCSE